MKRFVRTATAVATLLCLLLSICSTGIVVFAQQQKTTYYVSLGDSMTNGLGMLSGYDAHNSTGYLEVAYDAYPAQLSAWMAGYEGKISAGQTEYKGSNGTVKLTQLATSGMRAEDLHYILKYGQPGAYAGDDYMYTEVLQPGGRWNSAYAGGAAKVSQKFRDSIAEADVITMAVGNANFGVYLSSMMSDINGTGSNRVNYDHCTLENALVNADPEFAALGLQIVDLALGFMTEFLPEEQARTMADRVGYVVTNYIYHYNQALDEIARLNPDARIVIIGVFNTMSDMDANVTYNGEERYINLAELQHLIMSPINYYLSVLPARKQHQGGFDDITFHYAEVREVETLSSTFAEVFAEDKDFFRDRFVGDVAQSLFPLVDSDQPLASVSKADVDAYDQAVQKGAAAVAAYVLENPEKARAAAVYLSLEKALVRTVNETPDINLDEMMAHGGDDLLNGYLGYLLSEVMDSYHTKLSADAEAGLTQAAKAYLAAQKGSSMSSISDAAAKKALADPAQKQQIAQIARVLSVDAALTYALQQDERIDGVLTLYSRMELSSGMTSHPNAAGHDQMTQCIIEGIEKGSLDHTFDYTYLTTSGSHYLALGDATAYGTAANGFSQYVDSATANRVSVTNKTVKDQSALALLEDLQSYRTQIEQADLISLGFSANSFTNFVVSQLKLVLANKPIQELDWEGQLGGFAAEMIQELIASLKEKMVGSVGGVVMGLDVGQVATIAIESYAYSFVVHMVNYSKLIDEIMQINPNAQILLVGMYNPMQGIMLDMGKEPMDMGEYLQYLVDICNTISKGKASSEGKCTFIAIPEVQTGAKPATYEMVPFFMDLLMKGTVKYNPSQAGYDYIRQQMCNALTVMPAAAYSAHIHEYYDWRVIQAATSTAEGIKQRDCVHCGHYEQRTIPVQTGPSQITSDKFAISVNTVSKIADGTTVAQLLQGLGEAEYIKVYKDNQEISGDKKIGTGMEIRLIVGGQTVQSLTAIVTGDTNGDGVITVTDMLAVKSHVLNKSKLSGVSFTAGDTNGDGNITITDFIQVKAQILGKSDVTPR